MISVGISPIEYNTVAQSITTCVLPRRNCHTIGNIIIGFRIAQLQHPITKLGYPETGILGKVEAHFVINPEQLKQVKVHRIMT